MYAEGLEQAVISLMQTVLNMCVYNFDGIKCYNQSNLVIGLILFENFFTTKEFFDADFLKWLDYGL